MCNSVAFSTFTILCNPPLYLVPKHSHIPKGNLYLLSSYSPFSPPRPWQTLTYFLFLWIYLFWVFNISETIQYMTFCVWLLLLSIFLRFIHAVTHISILFLFMTEWHSIVWIYHILFIYSSIDRHFFLLCYIVFAAPQLAGILVP